jgi:hypothetical protein
MAFLYKQGYFPTLKLDRMSNVVLTTAPKRDGYVMYMIIGDDLVLQVEKKWRGDSLFESFCVMVEEKVGKVIAEIEQKKISVEKEGWVLDG